MSEPDAVYMGRPVELDVNDPVDRGIIENTYVYSGSVQMPCVLCGKATWIGPRGQEALAAKPEIQVVCSRCTIQAGQRGDIPLGITHLGNPEKF